jgi:hypothetical protein
MPAGGEEQVIAFCEDLLGIKHLPSRRTSPSVEAAGSRTASCSGGRPFPAIYLVSDVMQSIQGPD